MTHAPRQSNGFVRPLLAALVVTAALSWALLASCFPGTSALVAGSGLAVVMANAFLAHMLYQLALRARSSNGFLLWSLGGSVARGLLLVVLLMACHVGMTAGGFLPFLAVVLTGYFIFMAFEVMYLHVHAHRVRAVS